MCSYTGNTWELVSQFLVAPRSGLDSDPRRSEAMLESRGTLGERHDVCYSEISMTGSLDFFFFFFFPSSTDELNHWDRRPDDPSCERAEAEPVTPRLGHVDFCSFSGSRVGPE